MKLGDVDLNNIKVSIFDFDETLAIHKDKNFTKHRSESEESFTNWYYNAYKNPNKFNDEIEPCTKSEILYNLINNLRKINKNVDINILNSSKNINIDAVLGYKSKNLKYNFLDDYEERNIFDE